MTRLLLFWVIAIGLCREPADILAQTPVPVLLETLMGRQFTRPSLIAAFPIDAISPGNIIVFRYSSFAGLREGHSGITIKEEVRRVVITKGDLRKWK